MTRILRKCDLTKQLHIHLHKQNSLSQCKLMDYMHKKVIPVKYQVNKYEKFCLFITIVTEIYFAERERKKCLCLAFLFFYTKYKGLFPSTILLLYNSKTHPEVQWLVEDFLLRLSSSPMV